MEAITQTTKKSERTVFQIEEKQVERGRNLVSSEGGRR